MIEEYRIGETFFAGDPEFVSELKESEIYTMLAPVDDMIRQLLGVKSILAMQLAEIVREYYPALENYEFMITTDYDSTPTITIIRERYKGEE